MNNADSIKFILDKIANDLQTNMVSKHQNSFANLSRLIFFVQYSQYTGKNFSLLIKEGIEKQYATYNLNNTFWDGKAGQYSFYTYLFRKGIIDTNDFHFLTENDKSLQEFSIDILKKGNCDFLYGAVGIAYYYLYNYSEKNKPYLIQFFCELKMLLDRSPNMFEAYNLDFDGIKEGQVHISIPHGIVGILKLSIECYRKDICRDVLSVLINKITDYLYKHKLNSGSYTFYNIIHSDNTTSNSRLAWCYGDLGAGIIIYQCGCYLGNNKLKTFGNDIMTNCALIKNDAASIYDASICHGTSGAAYIFGKMFSYSGNKLFSSIQDYWVNQTLNFVPYDGVIRNQYDDTLENYDDKIDILNGVSGIGLSLLSYLNKDFSWDYIIMLND